jgi:hypothetical protein
LSMLISLVMALHPVYEPTAAVRVGKPVRAETRPAWH